MLPPRQPFVGHLLRLRQDPLRFMQQAAELGDVVPLYLPRLSYLINDPELVKVILVEKSKNYRKGPMNRRPKTFLGEGLLTSEGKWWRQQRQLMQPLFSPARLSALIPVIAETVERLAQRWRNNAQSDTCINLHAEMIRAATTVIGEIVMGINLLDESESLAEAVTQGGER